METNPASSTTASVSLKRNASSMDDDVAANAKRVRSDEPPPGHPHSASPIVQQALPVTRTVEFALKRSPSGSAPAAASANDPPPGTPTTGPTSTAPDGDPDAAFRAAVLAKLAEASSGSSASPSTASTRTGALPPIPDQPTTAALEVREVDKEEDESEEETDDPDAERSDGGWDDEDEWVPPQAAAAVPTGRNSSSVDIAPEANGQTLMSPPPTPAPTRTDASSGSAVPPAPPPEPTPDVAFATAAAPDVLAPDDLANAATTTAAFSAVIAEHEQLPNTDADVDDDWLEAVAPSNFALPDEPWATSPPTLPLDDLNPEELSPLTQPTHPASLGSSPPPISALLNHHHQSGRARSRSLDSYADSGDELNQHAEDVPVAPGFALRGSDGAKVQCALCGRWMGPEKTAEHVARVCGTIPKPDRKPERKPKHRRSTRRSSTSMSPKKPRSPRKEKPVLLPAAKLAARRAELATDRWAAQVDDARGVLCSACGVWVDVGGPGLGAVQRWSGRTGHKSACGVVVETVKREEAEAKMRELTHAHEAPAPVPLEILADKRLRRIDGDQAQCNVCGVWTLFKNWDAHQGGKCEQIRARREAKAARREAKQAMRRAAKAGAAGAKGLDALSDLSSDSGDELEGGSGGKLPVRFPGMVYTGGAAASGSGTAATATGSGSAGTTATAASGFAPATAAAASASTVATATAASSASTTIGTTAGASASASTVPAETAAFPAAFLAQPVRQETTASSAGGSAFATATVAVVSTSASSSSAAVPSSFGPFRFAPVNAKAAATSASGPAPKSAPGWPAPPAGVPAFPWKPWVSDPRFAFGSGPIPADYAQKMYQAQGMRIVPPGYMPVPAAKGKAKASAPAPAAPASASASTSAKPSGPALVSSSTSGPASTSNGQKAAPVTGKRAAGPSAESPAAKKAKVDAASVAGPSKKKAAATAGPATPSAAKSAAATPAAVPPATAKKSAASQSATPTAATPKPLPRQLAHKRSGPPPPYRPGKNKRPTAFSKAASAREASSSSSSSSSNSKSEKELKEWCNAPLPYVLKGPPSRAMEVHGTYQLCGLEVSVSSAHYRTTRFEDLPTDPEDLLRLERQVILYYDADVAEVAEENAIKCKNCNEWVLLPRSGVPTKNWYGNTGHKACCEKKESRQAVELREAMEGIPEVRFEEPFRIRRIKGDKVQCAGCGKPVTATMWARHVEERCTFYTAPSTAPKYESNGSDSEAADGWAAKGKQVPLEVTIAKRRAQLLEDVAVREIGKDKLLCDPCGKWVKIAKHLYAEYKWYGPQGHRDRCVAQHPNWKPRADKDEPPLSPAASVPVTPAKPGSSIPATASKSSVIARRPPTKPAAAPPSSPVSVIVIPDTSSDHEIPEDEDEYNPDDDGSGADSESSEDPDLDL